MSCDNYCGLLDVRGQSFEVIPYTEKVTKIHRKVITIISWVHEFTFVEAWDQPQRLARQVSKVPDCE